MKRLYLAAIMACLFAIQGTVAQTNGRLAPKLTALYQRADSLCAQKAVKGRKPVIGMKARHRHHHHPEEEQPRGGLRLRQGRHDGRGHALPHCLYALPHCLYRRPAGAGHRGAHARRTAHDGRSGCRPGLLRPRAPSTAGRGERRARRLRAAALQEGPRAAHAHLRHLPRPADDQRGHGRHAVARHSFRLPAIGTLPPPNRRQHHSRHRPTTSASCPERCRPRCSDSQPPE